MIDPAVLHELIRIVEATRGHDHPVSVLLRRAAATNSLKDYVEAWMALDRLTLGEPDQMHDDGDVGAAGAAAPHRPDIPPTRKAPRGHPA